MMYAVVSRFKFKRPLTDELGARIEKEAVDPWTKMPGFRSYDVFFSAADRTEVVSFHTWDSQADAERALQSQMATGTFQTLAGDELAEPPQRWLGEIRAHRGP